MPNELELKLRLAPQHLQRLSRHPLVAGLAYDKPILRKLHSTYYDTPGFALRSAGYALRVRRVGRRWVQAAKGEGRVAAGLHERREWEAEVAGSAPDLTKLTDPELSKILASPEVREALIPVFTTEFRRTARNLRFPDGSEAELALDRGEVRTGGGQRPLCEVELELKSGNPARLFELARELQKTIPFSLEPVSKAERGYRLAGAQPSPLKAASPELPLEIRVNEGFKGIVWNCLGQLHGNEEGLLEAQDAEYLHQMRVGLRRVRSALGIFSEVLNPMTPLRAELKWLGSRLGPARDWDVFATQVLPPVLAAFPDHAGLAALRDAADALRAENNALARATVRSARYQALLLDFGAWLHAEPWRSGAGEVRLNESLQSFATAILDKRHRQLRKRGRHFARLTPQERHVLRIAAKKLRYAAEFFAPLYSRKEARSYLQALSRLQDVLGFLNDTATARTLLEEPAGRGGIDPEAFGLVLGWVARAAEDAATDLKRAWDGFCEEAPFWKDGT